MSSQYGLKKSRRCLFSSARLDILSSEMKHMLLTAYECASYEWATMLMSQLCARNEDAKSEFKSLGGVKRFLNFLKNSVEGMFLPEVLIGSIVNLLSCAIVGHKELEKQFFDQEGAKVLLDLLNSCPRFMRNIVLGFLADLAKSNDDASFFYNLWRSPQTSRTLRQRLVEFWLQEETRLGVTREKQGQIRNLKFPATESDMGTCTSPRSRTYGVESFHLKDKEFLYTQKSKLKFSHSIMTKTRTPQVRTNACVEHFKRVIRTEAHLWNIFRRE